MNFFFKIKKNKFIVFHINLVLFVYQTVRNINIKLKLELKLWLCSHSKNIVFFYIYLIVSCINFCNKLKIIKIKKFL